jgi:hypothetical protein
LGADLLDKFVTFLHWLLLAVVTAGLTFVLIAFGTAYSRTHHTNPKPPEAVAAAYGPGCTSVYPRGFKVPRITNKHPVCQNGDLQSTWRGCELRYKS